MPNLRLNTAKLRTAAVLFAVSIGLLLVIGARGFQVVESQASYEARRRQMVETQLRKRGIRNPVVLDAMGRVPRHRFVPRPMRGLAYNDGPLPIGQGQTISQPYIVALMTE